MDIYTGMIKDIGGLIYNISMALVTFMLWHFENQRKSLRTVHDKPDTLPTVKERIDIELNQVDYTVLKWIKIAAGIFAVGVVLQLVGILFTCVDIK